MPRFVVQRHRARNLHYDLRLEVAGALASWAVPKGPTLDPAVRRAAFRVEDHDLDYYDYEGPVGTGDAIVWDLGRYEPEGDPAAALEAGELHMDLFGEKLSGRFALINTRGSEWLLVHKRDEHAVAGWNPEEHPRSALTGRTNDEVRDAPLT